MDDGAGKEEEAQTAGRQGADRDRVRDANQEYDFFVNQQDGRSVEDETGFKRRRGKKRREGRSKSRTFFLSD